MKLTSSLPGFRPDTLWPCRLESLLANTFSIGTALPSLEHPKWRLTSIFGCLPQRMEGPTKLENSHGEHESGGVRAVHFRVSEESIAGEREGTTSSRRGFGITRRHGTQDPHHRGHRETQ